MFGKKSNTNPMQMEDFLVNNESNVSDIANSIQEKIDRQQKQYENAENGTGKEKRKLSSEERLIERKKKLNAEEQKYDLLLNSVQAQNLIKTVNKMEKGLKEKKKEPVKKEEPVKNVQPVKKEEPIKIVEPIEKVNTNAFNITELSSYVSGQCEVMREATEKIDKAMEEYNDVTEYFSDVEKIDQAPEAVRKQIEFLARKINDLYVDRRISKVNETKISTSVYRRMERYEEEIPVNFSTIKSQESYFESVKRDIRMLKGEQLSYRLEADMLVKRQFRIKGISKIAAVGILMGFVVCVFAMAADTDDSGSYNVYYILVTLIAAIISVGLFALLKNTERQVLVTEAKLNKTTNLLNKTKIKYINCANTLDYEFTKYGVKSSYELEKKYQAYLEMKEDQKKVLGMSSQLSEAERNLEAELSKLGLYDTHIWQAQVKALYNPKEMVEVRHELTVQRQKLRALMEYNENKIEEAKRNIKLLTQEHPQFTQQAMRIIDSFKL